MKKYKYLLGCLFLFPIISKAQTEEDKIKISNYSNKEGNIKLLSELKKVDYERKIRLSNFLNHNPNFKKTTKIGLIGVQELLDILPDGEKIYARTTNAGAATTARANHLYGGGSLGINIQGQNMRAAVWDGGNARDTHQEFMVGGNSKITLADGVNYQDHATHVAGTIAAQGISSLVRGVAFNSSITSYDWTSDLTEMLTEASTGLLVSNHSYGIGQLSSLWFYGAYDSRARQIDNICYNNQFYLPIVSAGNDRNETAAPGSTQIANKAGYDMIFGHGNAKNIITVAAVNQVTTYTDPSSVVMSSFSSWGPSDDGRIKPDISMKGVNVRSTLSTSDTATGLMSGTSMASPGITGVVLLLQQYYNQLYSNYMKAATVKGLILHTADEAGSYTGPDYEFGWGLVNAQKSAITIRDKNSTTSTSKSVIEELNLANNSTFTKTVTASGTNPLKISISWTDPQAPTNNSGTIDPTTKYLVNDLDIKVVKNSVTYYPWKLQGMAAPYDSPSNNSTNDVDNFERVDIDNPSGTYTISVTHKGTLSGGNQNFSLIVTSDNLSTLSTSEVNKMDNEVNFYPNPAKDFITIGEKEPNLVISIYDASGKFVLSDKNADNKINISRLVKGMYFANYTTSKGIKKNFKFTKE
ncbi:S8 family serine peptidase [Chryseobacterium chendengshani]|uniref:S8 family serine peptidase n=1 Tax=Chryseobacterium sp. LJ668 TaxID=2864040 RepID=UPI001C6879A2|nr:S8 family serine peptidase [Chryseobacterium sp. LJ668]MBW8521800.1 S8 family serine peptidase [Chryseobacterium sp. LJ668]QYK17462.1 S8 family serine peptidase [Chryseobacterium sp. LJ668]